MLAAVLAIAVIGASLITVNYFAIAPGDARPSGPRVEVQGVPTYDSRGQVLFVTVSIPHLTALSYVMGKLESNTDVVPAKAVLGDQTEQQNREENLRLMTYSKDFASYVALTRLGFKAQVSNGGVVVDNLCLAQGQNGACTSESPAAKVLQKNDIITKLGSTPVNVVPDLAAALKGKKAGDTVTLVVKRKQPEPHRTDQAHRVVGRPRHHRLHPESVAARLDHVLVPLPRVDRLGFSGWSLGRAGFHAGAARRADARRALGRREGGGHRHYRSRRQRGRHRWSRAEDRRRDANGRQGVPGSCRPDQGGANRGPG